MLAAPGGVTPAVPAQAGVAVPPAGPPAVVPATVGVTPGAAAGIPAPTPTAADPSPGGSTLPPAGGNPLSRFGFVSHTPLQRGTSAVSSVSAVAPGGTSLVAQTFGGAGHQIHRPSNALAAADPTHPAFTTVPGVGRATAANPTGITGAISPTVLLNSHSLTSPAAVVGGVSTIRPPTGGTNPADRRDVGGKAGPVSAPTGGRMAAMATAAVSAAPSGSAPDATAASPTPTSPPPTSPPAGSSPVSPPPTSPPVSPPPTSPPISPPPTSPPVSPPPTSPPTSPPVVPPPPTSPPVSPPPPTTGSGGSTVTRNDQSSGTFSFTLTESGSDANGAYTLKSTGTGTFSQSGDPTTAPAAGTITISTQLHRGTGGVTTSDPTTTATRSFTPSATGVLLGFDVDGYVAGAFGVAVASATSYSLDATGSDQFTDQDSETDTTSDTTTGDTNTDTVKDSDGGNDSYHLSVTGTGTARSYTYDANSADTYTLTEDDTDQVATTGESDSETFDETDTGSDTESDHESGTVAADGTTQVGSFNFTDGITDSLNETDAGTDQKTATGDTGTETYGETATGTGTETVSVSGSPASWTATVDATEDDTDTDTDQGTEDVTGTGGSGSSGTTDDANWKETDSGTLHDTLHVSATGSTAADGTDTVSVGNLNYSLTGTVGFDAADGDVLSGTQGADTSSETLTETGNGQDQVALQVTGADAGGYAVTDAETITDAFTDGDTGKDAWSDPYSSTDPTTGQTTTGSDAGNDGYNESDTGSETAVLNSGGSLDAAGNFTPGGYDADIQGSGSTTGSDTGQDTVTVSGETDADSVTDSSTASDNYHLHLTNPGTQASGSGDGTTGSGTGGGYGPNTGGSGGGTTGSGTAAPTQATLDVTATGTFGDTDDDTDTWAGGSSGGGGAGGSYGMNGGTGTGGAGSGGGTAQDNQTQTDSATITVGLTGTLGSTGSLTPAGSEVEIDGKNTFGNTDAVNTDTTAGGTEDKVSQTDGASGTNTYTVTAAANPDGSQQLSDKESTKDQLNVSAALQQVGGTGSATDFANLSGPLGVTVQQSGAVPAGGGPVTFAPATGSDSADLTESYQQTTVTYPAVAAWEYGLPTNADAVPATVVTTAVLSDPSLRATEADTEAAGVWAPGAVSYADAPTLTTTTVATFDGGSYAVLGQSPPVPGSPSGSHTVVTVQALSESDTGSGAGVTGADATTVSSRDDLTLTYATPAVTGSVTSHALTSTKNALTGQAGAGGAGTASGADAEVVHTERTVRLSFTSGGHTQGYTDQYTDDETKAGSLAPGGPPAETGATGGGGETTTTTSTTAGPAGTSVDTTTGQSDWLHGWADGGPTQQTRGSSVETITGNDPTTGAPLDQTYTQGESPYTVAAEPRDGFAALSDFGAAMGDKVSGGLTKRVRQALGYDDVVNYNSSAYAAGEIAGEVVSQGVQNLTPCRFVGLARAGVRAVHAAQAAGQVLDAGAAVQAGDYAGGLTNLAGATASLKTMLKSCFVAGTPLLTPDGAKPIEQFRVGDEVLSRDEYDPEADVRPRKVLQVFARVSPVLHLHAGGRIIAAVDGRPPRHPVIG